MDESDAGGSLAKYTRPSKIAALVSVTLHFNLLLSQLAHQGNRGVLASVYDVGPRLLCQTISKSLGNLKTGGLLSLNTDIFISCLGLSANNAL